MSETKKVPKRKLKGVGITALVDDTATGLFETERGDKYVIIQYEGAKIAVSLVNPNLPEFTWVALCHLEAEWGRWLGPYRLRLIHATGHDELECAGGQISLLDGRAVIHCRAFSGVSCYFPLGHVPDDAAEGEYDGWMMETVKGERLFFERSHIREGSLVIDLQEVPSRPCK